MFKEISVNICALRTAVAIPILSWLLLTAGCSSRSGLTETDVRRLFRKHSTAFERLRQMAATNTLPRPVGRWNIGSFGWRGQDKWSAEKTGVEYTLQAVLKEVSLPPATYDEIIVLLDEVLADQLTADGASLEILLCSRGTLIHGEAVSIEHLQQAPFQTVSSTAGLRKPGTQGVAYVPLKDGWYMVFSWD